MSLLVALYHMREQKSCIISPDKFLQTKRRGKNDKIKSFKDLSSMVH